MLCILDNETFKHTAQYQPETPDVIEFTKFKAKVMEFTNMIDASIRTDRIKAIKEEDHTKEDDWWTDDWPEEDNQDQPKGEDEATEQLHRFQGNCWNCGGEGHAAAMCPW